MVDVDSETLFNGAAAVVSTIAVVFFILNVDWGYSPVSKVALVVLFLAGIFAVTQRAADQQLTVLGYGVVVTSVVVLFFDLTSTFDADAIVTVVGLLLIAAVLFGARSGLDEENHFVSGQTATRALAIVAVLAAGVLVVDVATGGLAYELQTQSQVEFQGETRERSGARLGTLVISNPAPFPERVEAPRYSACTAGNWSEYRRPTPEGERPREVHTHLRIDVGYDAHIFGFSTKRYPIRIHVEGVNLQGETFPVEVTEQCPDDETGEPYVAVFVSEERRYYADAA